MYIVEISDFQYEVIGTCAVKQIADAIATAKSVGYAADVIDATTGEVLWTRVGSEIIYSIFE